jgi:hypothetical protein
MDTREIIVLGVRILVAGVLLWGIIYSLYSGIRFGFRFPRSLHCLALGILALEVVTLVAFPIPVKEIGIVLGGLLLLLPFSPYVGWILAGGPARLCR